MGFVSGALRRCIVAAVVAAAMIVGVVSVVPGTVNPAAAADGPPCEYDIPEVDSTVNIVRDSWSPNCVSSNQGSPYHSKYYKVTTGSSGGAVFVVESCTAVSLTVLKEGNERLDFVSQGFSGFHLTGYNFQGRQNPGGSGLNVLHTRAEGPYGPFTQYKAIAAVRHLEEATQVRTDRENLDGFKWITSSLDPDRWSLLEADTEYTVEVSALHAGQLGRFTLQYKDGDGGFTATPGYCSTDTSGAGLKPPPSSFSCMSSFPVNRCLHETDPTFWRPLPLNVKNDIRDGDYSNRSVFPAATIPNGVIGSSGPPVADSAPTVADTSRLKTHYATVGESFTLVLPAADANSGNGGPYVYKLLNRSDGTAFGTNGLSFDASTRTLSGAPLAEETHLLAYEVQDGDGNQAKSDSFIDEANLKVVVLPSGNAVGNSAPEPPPEFRMVEIAPSPPTASAGADFDAKRGETGITLNGSGTAHAEGSQALTYQWAVTKASHSEVKTVAAGFLTGADQAAAGFTVPKKKDMTKANRSELNNGAWIEFTLTVKDGDGETHTDTVRLTIKGTTWKPPKKT